MDKDFVKGKVEVKTFDNGGKIMKLAIPFEELQRINNGGWVNIDIKTGKASGKLYMENNTYKPSQPDSKFPQYDQEQGNPEQGGHAEQFPPY